MTNAIKITAAFATLLETNSWVIIADEYVVGAYKSRQAAREAKADENLEGSIKNKSEVEFVTVAPIGEDFKVDFGSDNVHDYVCPHCGIHLSNGVGVHGDEVNGKVIKHDEYEYECLACGGEFGPAISSQKPAKAAPKKTVVVTNESTVERPCKKVWEIADNMKGQKRAAVLAACVEAGIAFYTARTQYQQWRMIQKEMAEREAQQAAAKKA